MRRNYQCSTAKVAPDKKDKRFMKEFGQRRSKARTNCYQSQTVKHIS